MIGNPMKLVALCTLLVAMFTPAGAQDNAQAMHAAAEQLRATARQMQGQISAAEVAEMLQSADEIDKSIAEGAFSQPTPGPAVGAADLHPLIEKIRAEHGVRLDWLTKEVACAGFIWETADYFKMQTGDRDDERNALCAAAWREYRTYFVMTRDQGGYPPAAMAALERYERAAHAAVDFYERR